MKQKNNNKLNNEKCKWYLWFDFYQWQIRLNLSNFLSVRHVKLFTKFFLTERKKAVTYHYLHLLTFQNIMMAFNFYFEDRYPLFMNHVLNADRTILDKTYFICGGEKFISVILNHDFAFVGLEARFLCIIDHLLQIKTIPETRWGVRDSLAEQKFKGKVRRFKTYILFLLWAAFLDF